MWVVSSLGWCLRFYKSEEAEQGHGEQPVSTTPPQTLYQLLSSGSCPGLDEELLYLTVSGIKPFLFKLPLVMRFHHSNSNPN